MLPRRGGRQAILLLMGWEILEKWLYLSSFFATVHPNHEADVSEDVSVETNARYGMVRL